MKRNILLSLSLLMLALIFAASRAQVPASQKLRAAEQAIAQLYVDTVNEDRLVEDAIKGMLEGLDPHSSYSNAEETRELNEPLQGNFSGIGISFNMTSDTLYVIQTIPGGPSERVGLLAGDRILKVNDTIIAGVKMRNSDIMKRLRGPKGSTVDIRVMRRSAGKTDSIDFRITRDDIPIHSVDAAYMVNDSTGYIRVNKFAADTRSEVEEAMISLLGQGMRNLILDLTDNGGGYLNAAVEILGELLEPGRMTVYTEGRNSPRTEMPARPRGIKPLFGDGRLVVMANQYSASAAEITAGAIQDWDRGVVVGRRTFGKGLVQRPLPFPDGSMIRLTVAHYYTPTGRDIQKPYTKGDQKSYAHDIIDRLNRGELMHADSIRVVDSLRVNTLRLNRPIYGGGGITPDFFVAIDTTDYTPYYRNVMAKGAINKYVIGYVDENRKAIRKLYPTDGDYVKKFTVSDNMLDDLYKIAAAEGVDPDSEQAEKSAPLFKTIIKALIGRDVYESATYFKVWNRYDPIFREALRVIESDDYNRTLSPAQ
ncbi:MAG: S41 family peptidase [Bacteroides sp.]|nr:S41 family peptidase [Bacteroides sp.]MBD5291270.1 S41 family peptidase [Bacteroides sp.]